MTWVSEPTGQLSVFIQLLAHPRAFVRAEITRLNIKRCNINAKYVCGEWVVKMGTKDIYLEILLQTRCCFLEWLFFYHSLPTTADSQEHPWSNICKHNVLYIIIITLAKVITAKIAPGPTAEKHYSFPCKECSVWFVCRTRQQERFHPLEAPFWLWRADQFLQRSISPQKKIKEAMPNKQLLETRELNILMRSCFVFKVLSREMKRRINSSPFCNETFKINSQSLWNKPSRLNNMLFCSKDHPPHLPSRVPGMTAFQMLHTQKQHVAF